MQKLTEVDLRPYSTFRLQAKAKKVYVLEEEKDYSLLKEFKEAGEDYFLLARGSNVLFAPKVKKNIVQIKRNGTIKIKTDNKDWVWIEVSAETSLPRLLRFCLSFGFSGLEGLVGIPGSVGGAIAMNAGSFGYEMGKVLTELMVWSLEGKVQLTLKDVRLGYRTFECNLDDYAILNVVLKLRKTGPQEVKAKLKKYYGQKKQTQPLTYPSVGCIFKNPLGKSAGKILDECGLKGVRKGDVVFSEKHANFLLNLGGGRSDDALYLLKLAQEKVARRTGLSLEPEVKIVD